MSDIRDAERGVVEAAEAFVGAWTGTLHDAYDAANGVVHAVRELRRTSKRIAREAKKLIRP